MRIDDILNQAAFTKQRLSSYQKQPQAAAFGQSPTQDSVTISPEARAARQNGGYFSQAKQEGSEANASFKAYMDKITGRVPQAPKTTEEKIKELTEKIKQLQSRLSEVATNPNLPESTKSDQVTAITAQINAAYAELDEVGKEAAETGDVKVTL